jgi:hypothetical protein
MKALSRRAAACRDLLNALIDGDLYTVTALCGARQLFTTACTLGTSAGGMRAS